MARTAGTASRTRALRPWPASDTLRLILIEWPGLRVPLRARAPCTLGLPVSAQVPWRWASSVSAPPRSLKPLDRLLALARARALDRRSNLSRWF
jgi:hypothetical protein